MLSPKMIIGMVKSMLTDSAVQSAFQSLTEFIQEKNTEAGAGKMYRMVLEPTADNSDVILSIYLYDADTQINTPVKVLPLSTVSADDIKTLLDKLTEKK